MQVRHIQALSLAVALLACSAAPQTASEAQSVIPSGAGGFDTTVPKDAPLQPTITNVPATTGRGNLPAAPPPFRTTVLATFDTPFAVALLPGNDGMLVTEKGGTLKLRRADGSIVTVSGVPTVAPGGQGGLLDVAVAPGYAQNHAIYLSYSEPGADGRALALARATLDPTTIRCIRAPCPPGEAALRDVTVVWRSGSNGPGQQFGGNILFAPDGKTLFLSSGERQRFMPAQDLRQPIGKILRLTLDGKAAPGNPMAARGGAAAMIWSLGHRNPYGLAFAPGGQLWEVEMGPKGGDELNLVLPGRNYGWPIVSNGDNYSGQPIPDHPSRTDFEAPKLWWNPSISPSGLIYYSGAMFPDLRGSLLITSMSTPGLSRVTIDGTGAKSVAYWDFGKRLRDIAQGPKGEIYLLEDGKDARLLRLDAR